MQNKMILGLNGYVLSPFGAADMNDPAYGWGGAGATSVPSAQTGSDNVVSSIFTAIGGVGNAVASIFGAKLPTATAAQPGTLTAQQQFEQQQYLLRQQAEAKSAANMPLYIGGGLAALLLLGLVMKK